MTNNEQKSHLHIKKLTFLCYDLVNSLIEQTVLKLQ